MFPRAEYKVVCAVWEPALSYIHDGGNNGSFQNIKDYAQCLMQWNPFSSYIGCWNIKKEQIGKGKSKKGWHKKICGMRLLFKF